MWKSFRGLAAEMWKSFRGRMSGGHLRPLATTQVAASGRKWLPVTRECWRPLAATCGHSSGCKWLPFSKIKLRASCVLNVVSLRSHPVHVSRESPLSPSFSTSGTERGGHKTSTTAYFLPTLEDRTPSFTCFLRLRSCFLEIPPCFLLEETPWTA